MHPALLLAFYIAVVVFPVAAAWSLGYPPRPFWDEFSTALALMSFAGLMLEFVLSGRFRIISGHMGIDATMRFHQLMARSLTAFILAHPFLYSTGILNYPVPGDVTRQMTLGLALGSFLTGIIAWLALTALLMLAVLRKSTGWTYETWRLSHGLAAAVFAAGAIHHTLHAGRYSTSPVLTAYWLILLAVAIATLFWVYVITPLRQLGNPYEVKSVRKVASKTWELAIEPKHGEALRFDAGQFVWLTLGRSPFAITEHPFSIASCPAERPRIEFLIKEAGDSTSRIGELEVGDPAFVDGPHGALTLAGRDGSAIVFIAGGIGVAPLLSLLRQLAEDEASRPMLLIYGNRSVEQIIHRDEIEALRQRLKLEVDYVLSSSSPDWAFRRGRLDRSMLDACIPEKERASMLYLVCGPARLIDSVEEDLVALGVPLRQIVSEKFSYD